MAPTLKNNPPPGTIREERPLRVEIARAVSSALVEEIGIDATMDMMDYGCGTGLVVMALAPKMKSLTAVDTEQRLLEVLKEKIRTQGVENIVAKQYDLCDGLVPQSRFHLILSSMTLHHIVDIRQILDKFYQSLHPGGFLAIADLDEEDGDFHGGRPGVAHYGFNREKMMATLEQSGFSRLRSKTVHHIRKPATGGGEKSYTMFLIIGQKPVS